MRSNRRIAKDAAREQMLAQLTKQQIIGTDPIFWNRAYLGSYADRQERSDVWRKISNKYDKGELNVS